MPTTSKPVPRRAHHRCARAALLSALLALVLAPTASAEVAGKASVEGRLFPQAPASAEQLEHADHSLALELEHTRGWGAHTLTAKGFVRVDDQDRARSHADVRHLEYQWYTDRLELRAGVLKTFWGVTESNHLVDIVNQTDFVESLDGERKLGQPGLAAAIMAEPFGQLDLYLMTAFRERTYPGLRGRIRPIPRVDPDRADYQSPWRRLHPSAALRWSIHHGPLDLGLSYFYGTSREPRLLLENTGETGEPLVLAPYYDQIHQAGLDAQWTADGLLLKLESIGRFGQGDAFVATTGGLEYTWPSIAETSAELVVFLEYTHDRRTNEAFVLLEDDVFGALRLNLNDVQSTSITLGAIVDVHTGATLLELEAQRRLGDAWSATLTGVLVLSDDPTEPLTVLKRDSYLSAQLTRHF